MYKSNFMFIPEEMDALLAEDTVEINTEIPKSKLDDDKCIIQEQERQIKFLKETIEVLREALFSIADESVDALKNLRARGLY